MYFLYFFIYFLIHFIYFSHLSFLLGKGNWFLLRKCFSFPLFCSHENSCHFVDRDLRFWWQWLLVEGMGERGNVAFLVLSKMGVIQAEANRSQSFPGIFFFPLNYSWENFHSQSAIGERKSKIQEEQRREERILFES